MLDSRVIIFMGTYMGQMYLAEQLDSIIAQTHRNWEIWVSDDGSNDQTRDILERYQAMLGKEVLHVHTGPCKGYSTNFLSLVCNRKVCGEYFVYSDQDDIWESTKLERAIDWIKNTREEVPALYCARTKIVDSNKNHIGYSPLFSKNPGFLNAIVQNIGGGNTMMFNNATLRLLREAGNTMPVVAHDWWTYMLVTGAGGVCFYDIKPTVLYRQHSNNQIGANSGWKARINRIFRLFSNHFKIWNDVNSQALLHSLHLLTEENRIAYKKFVLARKSFFILRVIQMSRLGIYRQTFLGNMGLVVAMLFNKI